MQASRALTALAGVVGLTLATLTASIPASATPVRPAGTTTATAASPDFDGDGMVDVATAVTPNADESALRVHYGSGSTVTFTTAQLGARDECLGAVFAHDLNGDGYSDLVVSVATASGRQVDLLPGSAAGLDPQTPVVIPAPAEIGDKGAFGASFAVVDEPVRRLAIGVGYVYGDFVGAVVLYDLDADGRPSGSPQVITPSSVGISDSSSHFGESLASAANLLFVGAPVADVGTVLDAGAVAVLSLDADGVAASRIVSQATKSVTGTPARKDGFGSSLAAAGGYLAVGIPGDSVGRTKNTGSVELFRISNGVITPVRRLSQATAGVPGTAEKSDRFGASVALGTVCSGVTGVVVGGPNEKLGSHYSAGSAWVVPIKAGPRCTAHQLYPGHGLTGKPRYGLSLGSSVAVVRAAGATRDTVVLGGTGDDHDSGRLVTWSTTTRKVLSSWTESVYSIAGR
ncbi:MAG: VCBS repeat-containing protein [Propionicimonas sp.]|uniref:FG-GAP repeat domain-containing protein n=1 Tax=Propionicimonas sp. TaxID=1955623 RepID=UPI003D12C319